MGGKRRLAKQIIDLIPDDHTCYVEPFSGGAAVLFMKQPSKVEVLNDIDGELVNLYRVVKHHLEEFIKEFKHSLVSRRMFDWEKLKTPETLTDIQRAARFFYLQKQCFGGKRINQSFGISATNKPGLNLLRIEEDLSDAHLRLSQVFIENLAWDKCIERYDRRKTVFFCDPPYLDTTGYGVEFSIEQYNLLATMARNIKGRMIITLNDHPTIREIFHDFDMIETSLRYTVGGVKKNQDKRRELILRYGI